MATPSLLPADAEEEARELLYEAYNELQALAAELGGAAGVPAVVVVGHQTDGKSALVEALMGFQFNHVGGGTKTRRPVALHLRFNPRCDAPQCRLLAGPGDEDEDAGVAGRPMPLADIQVRRIGDGARAFVEMALPGVLYAFIRVCRLQCTTCVCVIAGVMY
jgi:hypothetical protein